MANTSGPNQPPGMSWKASGMVSAAMNAAPIATNMATRDRPSSARTTLPAQE
ncbi:Uncharacterised protein [Mycobacteroides abscessus subsp. abscessus]|nr:Uncharacterised protein [Mycobacteroides abscessus subsp. abscessus]